ILYYLRTRLGSVRLPKLDAVLWGFGEKITFSVHLDHLVVVKWPVDDVQPLEGDGSLRCAIALPEVKARMEEKQIPNLGQLPDQRRVEAVDDIANKLHSFYSAVGLQQFAAVR